MLIRLPCSVGSAANDSRSTRVKVPAQVALVVQPEFVQGALPGEPVMLLVAVEEETTVRAAIEEQAA